MPLMKLTDEDRQVLLESLKEVEIDYPQLELLDTIGEGTYGTYTIISCVVYLQFIQYSVCVYVIVGSWVVSDRQLFILRIAQYNILYAIEMCLLISCLVLTQLILTMKPVW